MPDAPCAHKNAWGLVCGHLQRHHQPSPNPLVGEVHCIMCANRHGIPTNQDAGDMVHEFEEVSGA